MALDAYVPSGFSEKEWAAKQAAEDKKKVAKTQFWTKKRAQGYEDLTEWCQERDKKFPGQVGAGHRFVKMKYDDKGLVKTVSKNEAVPKKGLFNFGKK